MPPASTTEAPPARSGSGGCTSSGPRPCDRAGRYGGRQALGGLWRAGAVPGLRTLRPSDFDHIGGSMSGIGETGATGGGRQFRRRQRTLRSLEGPDRCASRAGVTTDSRLKAVLPEKFAKDYEEECASRHPDDGAPRSGSGRRSRMFRREQRPRGVVVIAGNHGGRRHQFYAGRGSTRPAGIICRLPRMTTGTTGRRLRAAITRRPAGTVAAGSGPKVPSGRTPTIAGCLPLRDPPRIHGTAVGIKRSTTRADTARRSGRRARVISLDDERGVAAAAG